LMVYFYDESANSIYFWCRVESPLDDYRSEA
jgi:hypothetical protein